MMTRQNVKLQTVAVVGGGRWARVIVEVLCRSLPPTTTVAIVSPSNAAGMQLWADERRFPCPIAVAETRTELGGVNAAIIANSARDHEIAASDMLFARIPTLVEKPFAASPQAAMRLLATAEQFRVVLGSAHVFLFADYVHAFARRVGDAGGAHSLAVTWTDPPGESRHGETKRYDSSIPVISDVLPHITAILRTLAPTVAPQCRGVRVERGGADAQLDLVYADVPVTVRIGRDAMRRQRIIDAGCAGAALRLDFSTEPGMILSNGKVVPGDPAWDDKPSPLTAMLRAFLNAAAGGLRDDRLDPTIGLEACRATALALPAYRSAQTAWLVARAADPIQALDDGIAYGLRELLCGAHGARDASYSVATLWERLRRPDREAVIAGLSRESVRGEPA
jgi:predicted dehydrogenase